jgi:nephrocystin-4
MELFRMSNKRNNIINILNMAITAEHSIFASMGTTEFFEFVLRNPYNVEHSISVDCDDPELW